MEIGIHKVTIEQKNVLENLMTLFLHDLYEYASGTKKAGMPLMRYPGLNCLYRLIHTSAIRKKIVAITSYPAYTAISCNNILSKAV